MVIVPRRKSPQQREFEEYHRANPFVYKALLAATVYRVEEGKTHLSIKQLYEDLRTKRIPVTHDMASDFKLNNNHHSRYARLIMDENPDLAGIFKLRKLRS